MFTKEEIKFLKIANKGLLKANNAKDQYYARQSFEEINDGLYGGFYTVITNVMKRNFNDSEVFMIMNADMHYSYSGNDYIQSLIDFIDYHKIKFENKLTAAEKVNNANNRK